MDGYVVTSLTDMITELGENEVKLILSSFSCPHNSDVEKFLKRSAIPFGNQGIAQTHLVFCQYKKAVKLIAYFTLANKVFTIRDIKKMSNTYRKKLCRFGMLNSTSTAYIINAPLIAQLGKNFSHDLNKLITGDELLKLACDKVRSVQMILGGKFVYLECEDKEVLKDFYNRNGFVNFGNRPLDKDEKDDLCGDYLVQMLKYLK